MYLKNKYKMPLNGFPSDVYFTSVAQIEEYLSAPKLTCLLCGRQYKVLGMHIVVSHEVTLDYYRERYGLPYTKGLAIKEIKDLCSIRMKEKQDSGIVNKGAVNELIKARVETRDKMLKHHKQPFRRSVMKNNAQTHRKVFNSEENKILEMYSAGFTQREIATELSIGQTTVHRYINKHI